MPESYIDVTIDVLWCVVFLGQSGRSWDCDQRRPATPCCGGASWGVLWGCEMDCCSTPMVLNRYWTPFFLYNDSSCEFFFRFSCGSAAKFLHFYKSLLFAGCLFWHTLTRMHMRKPHQLGSRFLTEQNQSWCLRSCDCDNDMLCSHMLTCTATASHFRSIWDCSQLCFLQNASGLSQALGQYEATFGVRPLKVHTGVVYLLAISYWRGTLQSWSAIFEMGTARVHATWVFFWDLHCLF